MDSFNDSYVISTSTMSAQDSLDIQGALLSFFRSNWFEASCALLLVIVSLVRTACKFGYLSPGRGTKAAGRDVVLDGQDDRETDGEKQTRKLIYNLFDKANRDAPNVFELYENITKTRGINFRQYIRDDSHAQALFISLFTHAINTQRGEMVGALMADMRAMDIPRNLCFYASVMKVYASRGMYGDALRMYDYMVEENLQPDSMMYICLMNDAIACNDTNRANHFFKELCKVGKPSMRTYMTILRMYSKVKNWEAAFNILNDMKAAGATPDNLVFNNVLGVCVSSGQVAAAQKLVDTWQDVEGMLDVISFNTLLKGYAQVPDYDKSEAIIDRMQRVGPQPNLISFNTVMDCSVRAMQLLCSSPDKRRSKYSSSTPCATPTNGFRTPCATPTNGSRTPCATPSNGSRGWEQMNGQSSATFQAMARKPWDLLDRMEAMGLTPDRYTCSTLIKGMHLTGCSVREIDRAIQLLKKVGPAALQSKDNDNARLHEVLFNSMLDACVNARDLTRMAQVFEMMRECRVPVSAVTFGTLIKAFGQASRLDRCREVWNEMRRAGVRPTPVTYGCYIDACIRHNDMDTAMKVFEEMVPDRCKPNTVIYTSLIRGFARTKQADRALALYKDMKERGVECSNVTFNSLLDVIARHVPDAKEMGEVLDDMRGSNIQPDIVTYSILIKASCAAGNLDSAMSLFEQLKRERLVLDEIAFNSLLNGCSKNNKISYAESVFASMRELGVRPSNVTCSILVKMYGKAKMLDKATAVMELMENEYKEQPNLYVYTCLIQACVQNMQVKRGWDLFHDMPEKGIEPDGVTYGTLIHGCVYANKFDLAMTLVKRAYLVADQGAMSPTAKGRRQPAPDKVVPLQPEVLNALLSALNRKGKSDQAQELEDLMTNNKIHLDPRARKRTTSTSTPTSGGLAANLLPIPARRI